QDDYPLLTDEIGQSYSKIVTPGIHVYPFTFQHPHDGRTFQFGIFVLSTREELKVRIDVENNSSRTVKPKFCLYQKQSFFAMKRRKVRNKILLKEEGDPIGPSTKQSMTKVLNIPKDISVSILSCKVLKVEYRLKVSLDVKFASDPEIKLPVVLFSPPSLTQKADGIAPTSMHVGFESWTSSPAAWNSAACSGSAASDTVDGIYPSMYEWSEKPGGSFPVTHSNLQTTL
ncbi:hypothetical protein P4O66_012294, partial [Electrophorus voltai]